MASCLPMQTASLLLSVRWGLVLLSAAGLGDTVLVGQLLLLARHIQPLQMNCHCHHFCRRMCYLTCSRGVAQVVEGNEAGYQGSIHKSRGAQSGNLLRTGPAARVKSQAVTPPIILPSCNTAVALQQWPQQACLSAASNIPSDKIGWGRGPHLVTGLWGGTQWHFPLACDPLLCWRQHQALPQKSRCVAQNMALHQKSRCTWPNCRQRRDGAEAAPRHGAASCTHC